MKTITTPEIAAAYGYAPGSVQQLIRYDGFPSPLRRSRPYTFDAEAVALWFVLHHKRVLAARKANEARLRQWHRRDAD